MGTRRSSEVTRAQLDKAAPTSVAFLLRGGQFAPGGPPAPGGLMASPVLAIGCSDGVVRLLQLSTMRVVCKLLGGHKGGVSCVLAFPSKAEWKPPPEPTAEELEKAAKEAAEEAARREGSAGGGKRTKKKHRAPPPPEPPKRKPTLVPAHDVVVAGDSTGALHFWEPFARPIGASGEKEVPARATISAHSKDCWALCLAPGAEDAADTGARVFSAGADHRVAAWDAATFKELFRAKTSDAKAPATSLAYSHRYFALSGAQGLLMTTSNDKLSAMYTLGALPPERALRVCADLTGLVPAGASLVKCVLGGSCVVCRCFFCAWSTPLATPHRRMPQPTLSSLPLKKTQQKKPKKTNRQQVGAQGVRDRDEPAAPQPRRRRRQHRPRLPHL
jgi:hypothetical protein